MPTKSEPSKGFKTCESTPEDYQCLHADRRRTAATFADLSRSLPGEIPKLQGPIDGGFYFDLITRAERTNLQVKSLLIVRIDESDCRICFSYHLYYIEIRLHLL